MLILSYRVIYTHSPPTPPHPLLSTSSLYYHLLRWTPLLSYFLTLLSTSSLYYHLLRWTPLLSYFLTLLSTTAPPAAILYRKEEILDTHTRYASPAKPADDQKYLDSSTHHRRAP